MIRAGQSDLNSFVQGKWRHLEGWYYNVPFQSGNRWHPARNTECRMPDGVDLGEKQFW